MTAAAVFENTCRTVPGGCFFVGTKVRSALEMGQDGSLEAGVSKYIAVSAALGLKTCRFYEIASC